MKIDYKKAARLCTAGEFRLVEQSRPNNVAQLNLRDAKRRVEQARKQFDKWNQLSIEQDRQRGKGSDQGPERTRAKRDLFRVILNRFEARQKKIEAAESARERKAPADNKKPASVAPKRPFAGKPGKGFPAKGQGTFSPGSTAPNRTQRAKGRERVTQHKITQSGLTTRVRGHVSARGRRAQARRNVR